MSIIIFLSFMYFAQKYIKIIFKFQFTILLISLINQNSLNRSHKYNNDYMFLSLLNNFVIKNLFEFHLMIYKILSEEFVQKTEIKFD